MSSSYFNTAGAHLVDVNPLESNGPDNQSTPRQIVDVEFLDKMFATPTDAFIINDDVSDRFVQGFSFDVIGSSNYNNTYVVNQPGFPPGAVVAQVANEQTHIPVANITDTNNPVVYNFYSGFSTPTVSPTTPGNYLITWQFDGNQTSTISVNDQVQFKHFLYNDNVTNARVNRTYTVHSVTYNVIGFTNVVTMLSNEQPGSIMPIIGVDAQSVAVFPLPASAPYGYLQYTTPTPASSLRLVGQGSVIYNNETTWGESIQNNMIQLLENFAHTSAPISPMDGQLWFDTSAGDPNLGPALKLYNNLDWSGVVAEGLPVLGNIDMNDFKIASLTDATTTYPYIASTTGWGNNDQEAMNLRTSDLLYIAKTGGYDTVASHRSGTMTGVLSVSPHIEGREALTTSIGTTGMLRLGSIGQVGVSLMSNDSSFVYFDFVDSSYKRTNITYSFGTKLLEFGKYLDEVSGSAAGSINFSTGQYLTKKLSFTDNQELITKLFADTTYVNVTGDTMTGTLAMTAGANITLDSGGVLLGSSNNTVSILRNGASASSIVFNTASASTTTGNNVINLGNNMITGLSNAIGLTDAVSLQYADTRYVNVTGDTMTGFLTLHADPTSSLHATTKQYVDMFVSGIIWLTPVLDPNLFDDTLSAPPVVDAYTNYHKTFIVAGTGAGAWAGFDGHLMAYDGSTWQSVLGRAVGAGDRFGVFCEPDDDDPLSSLPGGGLTGHAGKIVTVTGVSPYTYSFYVPAEPDAFSVKGIFGNPAAYQSPHMGHSYTFRGVHGSGTFGTGYRWIEFSGPQMLTDGAGLQYTGNTLNVGAGTGLVANADDIAFATGNVLSLHNLATNGIVARTAANTVTSRTITGTTSNIVVTNGDGVSANPTIDLATVTQGATGTSFVKVALDGFGRVTNNTAVTSTDITTVLGYTPATSTELNNHINNTVGTAHAVVTTTANGFMTAADKVKLNAITGTNTGDQTTITGNAGSATVLQTARTINGVSFDGSANVTIPVSSHTHDYLTLTGGTLTGSTDATSKDTGTLILANGGLGVELSIYAGGNVTAYSDRRVKTNIERIPHALSKVMQLNGYTYDRTDVVMPRQTGVIAQEVLEVLPEAVVGTEDAYGVAYGNLVGLLIEAIKEQNATIQKMNQRIDELEAK